MPLVHIDLLEGRSPDYHAAVLDAVRTALVEAVDVSHERIIQRIHAVPEQCMDVPPGKSDRALVIEVTMLEGRTPQKKAAFYDAVRRELAEDPGIAPEDVYVVIRDTPSADTCLAQPLE
jgi:4-oxalocrotonate tautomerase